MLADFFGAELHATSAHARVSTFSGTIRFQRGSSLPPLRCRRSKYRGWMGARAQGFEVPVLHEQLVFVLLEEEAHAGDREGRSEAQRVVDDEVEIDELDPFE